MKVPPLIAVLCLLGFFSATPYSVAENLSVISPDGSRSLRIELPPSSILPEEVGVIVNINDPQSVEVADYYIARRGIPAENRIEISLNPQSIELPLTDFLAIRSGVVEQLSPRIQALALTFTKPYRFFGSGSDCNGTTGWCLSATTAFAFLPAVAGASAGIPLFYNRTYGKRSTRPFQDFGYRPTMMLAGVNAAEVKTVIDRSIAAEGTFPRGEACVMLSPDSLRSGLVIQGYSGSNLGSIFSQFAARWNRPDALSMTFLDGSAGDPAAWVSNRDDIIFYTVGSTYAYGFIGSRFIPGGVGYHPTSYGGRLLEEATSGQMSILRWLEAGASASFGTVREPYAIPSKFPNPEELITAYLSGRTAGEALSQSVRRLDEGLFVGDPLTRPFGPAEASLSNDGRLSVRTGLFLPGMRYIVEYDRTGSGIFEPLDSPIEVSNPRLSELSYSGISGGVVRITESDVTLPTWTGSLAGAEFYDGQQRSIELNATDNDLIADGGYEIAGIPMRRETLSQDSPRFVFDTKELPLGLQTLTAWAVDRAGNRIESQAQVRIVDRVPPLLEIRSPSSGSVVSGSLTLALTASDNRALAKISIFDGSQLVASSSSQAIFPSLETVQFRNGRRTLKVIAYDTSGNTQTRQVSITVKNPVQNPPTGRRDRGKPRISSASLRCNDAVCTVSVAAEDRGAPLSGLAFAEVVGTRSYGACWAVPRRRCGRVSDPLMFTEAQIRGEGPYLFHFPRPSSGRLSVKLAVFDKAGNRGRRSLSLRLP